MTFVRALGVAGRVIAVILRMVMAIGVGLVLGIVVVVVVGRRLLVKGHGAWTARRAGAAGRAAGLEAPSVSPCCDEGVVVSSVHGFLCGGCYQPVAGVVAPATQAQDTSDASSTPT